MLAVFAAISVILSVIAGPSYFFDIIKGKTKPQRTTWFIFSLIGLTAFFSQLALGGRWSIIFTGLDGLGSIATFLLSLKYGVGGWTIHDRLAVAISAVGIALSFMEHSPVIALLGVIIADVSGVVLTVRKTYNEPQSESLLMWNLIGLASIFSAFAVGKWDIGLLLFPVYLALANFAIPITAVASKVFHPVNPVKTK